MPLLVNVPFFGIVQLGLGLQFSIFPVIGMMKVRKPGALLFQSIFISVFLIFMFPPMALIIVCALVSETLALLIFRGYKNDWACVFAGTLYMPLTLPLMWLYYNAFYTVTGEEKAATSMFLGGANPAWLSAFRLPSSRSVSSARWSVCLSQGSSKSRSSENEILVFQKKIYPIFVFLASLFLIIFGLCMARNVKCSYFLAGCFVWLMLFGCRKGCFRVLPAFIIVGGLFAVIAYFAYGKDLNTAIAMANRFASVFLAAALGMSVEPADMTRNLSTLKMTRGVTLGMLIATSFPPVLGAEIKG